MDNEKLISKIFFEIQKDPSDYRAYEDVFSLCRSIEESDFKLAHDTNAELRSYISRGMKTSAYAKLFDLYRRSLLFDAPYKFDSYLLYIEINRKPEERFYQPRRRILKQVVDNLQKLVDDELDELFISMPPRVGKTTILMFFVTWLIGRNSESSNLYSAYSDTITKAFYNGVLETIQDPVTYLWKDVFPSAKVVQTNSADETLNIDRIDITDKAVEQAYLDNDVEKVVWVTIKDERRCVECRKRDGKIYDIAKVPPKPHLGCRCYLLPYWGGTD